MASFSFSFGGDDIEDDGTSAQPQTQTTQPLAQTATADSSAFPVQGKPQLPAESHDIHAMLARLPSKITYGTLDVDLGGGNTARLPRRELWDVRVQLAAEDDNLEAGGVADDTGLGRHDVRSGIYEGGFKSWESSVDLVKVLARDELSPARALARGPVRMIELGCGTALPSLAVFQSVAGRPAAVPSEQFPLSLTLADYNPSVLYLVTLPNFVLSWALAQREGSALLEEALSTEEGELQLTDEVKVAFVAFLEASRISLSFLSGGWSPALVELIYGGEQQATTAAPASTLVVGAETIYSPFALGAFADTLLDVLRREQGAGRAASGIVAAKRLYFGVGGSLDDFVDRMAGLGAAVSWLGEETEGVRRGVVQCSLP